MYLEHVDPQSSEVGALQESLGSQDGTGTPKVRVEHAMQSSTTS